MTTRPSEWAAENPPPANPGAGVNPADILFGLTTIKSYNGPYGCGTEISLA